MIVVSRNEVIQALREIDRLGVYKKNRSKKFCLVEKYHYPPKEVLRRAYRTGYGKPLPKLHGGPQTNTPLQNAGFTVISHGCGNTCKIV